MSVILPIAFAGSLALCGLVYWRPRLGVPLVAGVVLLWLASIVARSL